MIGSRRRTVAMSDENSPLTSTPKEANTPNIQQLIQRSKFRRRKKPTRRVTQLVQRSDIRRYTSADLVDNSVITPPSK